MTRPPSVAPAPTFDWSSRCRRSIDGQEVNEERMTEESSELRATDRITVLEGFGAMRVFLEAIWRRQGMTSQEIAFVLAGSQWMDGSPADPTIWDDWIAAVRVSSRDRPERKAAKPD
jgi:hypothetical protein